MGATQKGRIGQVHYAGTAAILIPCILNHGNEKYETTMGHWLKNPPPQLQNLLDYILQRLCWLEENIKSRKFGCSFMVGVGGLMFMASFHYESLGMIPNLL